MKTDESKHKQIEDHLLSGKSITGIQALSRFKVYRLSSVINRIRLKYGYDSIDTDNSEGYAIYRANPEIMKRQAI